MKISVFITSYNQYNYLCKAVDSVLSQTFSPYQIIIVDDASSDGSQDIIADYKRHYPELFTPIYHEKNTGIAKVRIDALNAVRGSYVTFVDGDDWFLPEKLEKEFNALRLHPEAQIAFSNNERVNEDGSKKINRWIDDETVPQGDIFLQTFARLFPKRTLFRSELVDYKAWLQVGFHDSLLALYEDFEMRIRLTRNLKAVYVDEILSCYRIHKNGLSRNDYFEHFVSIFYILKKNNSLLKKLPIDQYKMARKEFVIWAMHIGKKAVKEQVVKRNLKNLFILFILFNRIKYI